MTALPGGTVTFLLSDVEGSTALWEGHAEAMGTAVARLDEILQWAIEGHSGLLLKSKGEGDSAFAVFARASDAAAAATAAQEALAAEAWDGPVALRVRVALHTGEAELREGDYFGEAVNRAARLREIAYGGQTVLSQATYDQIQDRLADPAGVVDLGTHGLRNLARPEHVFELRHPGQDGGFPPLRSLNAVPNNLPAQLSSFVGREVELAEVARQLTGARLVTLTGVGGVGKTRLAVQAAAALVEEYPDGAWLVELAPLVDSRLVATTVASALRVPPWSGTDAIETVCRFLATRRALVVLDNCEHVIDAAADLVEAMLAAAPGVRVLATSREPLGVAGESAWRVPSLGIDADGGTGDAVMLFAERAARLHRGFVLDEATAGAATAICRRLDGIPLAIELAAARARVMSVEQIADRLDERFRLLTRGGRGAVARQQTLQGAIDWSYELLSPAERELFDALGVFSGDFDLEAVAAVAGLDEYEALDLLGQLVDKSMLEVDHHRDRYRLLETLRQYGWDRLVSGGRLGLAREAHAAWFTRVAGAQAARMAIPGQQVDALDRLDADYDNLRAALAYLIEQRRADVAARMARRLVGLFNIRHPREGCAWFEQVVAIADDLPDKARARLLADTAYAAYCGGDRWAEAGYAKAAVELGRDEAPAVAQYLLAQFFASTGDYTASAEHARHAIAAAVAEGDPTTRALAASSLVGALAGLGQEAEARSLIPDTIALAERLANPTITAAVCLILAWALELFGAVDHALVILEHGLADADAGGPIVACDLRATHALLVDEPNRAAAGLVTAIPIAKDQLDSYHQCYVLLATAKILAQTRREPLSAQLLGAYQQQGDATATRAFNAIAIKGRVATLTRQLTAAMGASDLDKEIRAGMQLSLPAALQLAQDAVAEIIEVGGGARPPTAVTPPRRTG